jgi:thiamine-monophosphate kinase
VPLPERKLISGVRREVQRAPSGRGSLAAGIGDDCALLRVPPRHQILVTTDFTLEGVHFRREWHPPRSVGHRCLARGLSDIAAMGGEPVAAFLSLALPAKLPQKWVDDFMGGLLVLAKQFGVPLAGGDTASSPAGIMADIVVVGALPRGEAVLRSTARPGDLVFVSGALGGSAAALQLLYAGKRLDPRSYPAHFFPAPRIEVARRLRRAEIVTSMIDLSDGLSTDLRHICEESRVGAEISAQSIPQAKFRDGAVELDLALHGGEDYELLFTARPGTRVPRSVAGVPITHVGRITRGRKIVLLPENGSRSELESRGWEHFRSTR